MSLADKVASFPKSPGIYVMKDAKSAVIYVGKAKNLRSRAQSYFKKEAESRYQVKFLMKRAKVIDYIVTDSEKEAILLEHTYIKKHKPRYNIELRDDKSYVSVMLSVKDKFPRIYVTRKIKKDKNLYFGPYSSSQSCRQTVDFLERHFQLRTCSDHELNNRSRPCIQYEIKRCPAPCVNFIDEESYGVLVNHAKMFLKGRDKELIKDLKNKMKLASKDEEYERAAKFRDLIESMQNTLEKQVVIRHRFVDQDYLSLYREEELVTVSVLKVREGKVFDTRYFHFKTIQEDSEILEAVMVQHYAEATFLPNEICSSEKILAKEALRDLFSEMKGRRVSISIPRKGEKAKLLALATRNAKEAFKRYRHKEETNQEILLNLQKNLHLNKVPSRMECYDISNFQGKSPTGSLVCFVDGKPAKKFYRHFKVKGEDEPNDYRMMLEVLQRRFLRAQNDTGGKWDLPDLVIVDGGKGQLGVAQKVFQDLEVMGVDLISLAKKKGDEKVDKVFLQGRSNPVLFKANSTSLHMLMRIRDEAHRFAITHHRKLRKKSVL